MSRSEFDLDIDPPEDAGPFLPRPEFFAALRKLACDPDLSVRYYAAEQFHLMLQGSTPKSEAAIHAADLVEHVLAERQAREGVEAFLALSQLPPDVDGQEWDCFGDEGDTSMLILEIVALPDIASRVAALSSLALHAANDADIVEPYVGHIHRFIRQARGEKAIRQIK